MESCLGPVLANIIMTELETVIVDKLFAANLLKFYIRYVDDTLTLIKESDINIVLKELNSFHPSLKFTVNKFDDDIVNYLLLLLLLLLLLHIWLLTMKLIYTLKTHTWINSCIFLHTLHGV